MLSRTLLVLGAVSAVTACGGSSGGTPPPPSACATPSGLQVALVYPVPNATSVPRTFGGVVIGSTSAFPTSWDAVLVSAVSTAGVFGGNFTAAPTPLPTPNVLPTFAHPVYQSSSFSGVVFPGVVVQVFLNNTTTNCVPTGPIAQFTTQ
ncbi:MAG: hypothetical protein ACXWNK_11195 [Vulcanimicrobiaceae bacterium]